jgi:hypothetical protein
VGSLEVISVLSYHPPVNVTNQPEAKLRLWALNPKPARLPRIDNLSRFSSRKFDSYQAFNTWKDELIRELIRRGGAKWTR